ncbi:helix-turn-helix domain-containing protein [Pseudomonas sp.]|uniref:helix-turn-helix domain-containing protein n=1 Tax=Pseudomonas sp. TaxID=306 RepID=UPI003BB69F09
MRIERALGRVLRDIRLQAGLTRAECNEALSIAKLSQVENGQAVIKIETLVGLCAVLGVAPSDVFLAVEAYCSGRRIEEQLVVSNTRVKALLSAGRFDSVTQDDARRGIRGQKADVTRDSVMRMQAEGLSKEEAARRLGVTLRTVQRHWVKSQ